MVQRPPISVALARFEDIVGRGLRSLIDEDDHLHLVATDVPQERLLATLRTYRPRVALLNFGSLSSAAELRELTQAFPMTRLVVLANRPTASECRTMLAFGATACLAKSTQARDVLHAIHLASRGLQVMPPSGQENGEPTGPELLTPREADVLELLQSGRSNAEIAHALHVSVETVRTHASRVYRKLGVASRRELRSRR
ncbi:MAG: response regulator transcription factor [Actinomycetota bacterium]|nr:response regulator transcription factor [Actinomycetota bacterium]